MQIKDPGKGYSIYFLLILVVVCVYVTGLFIPVMEVDAAQLASISGQLLRDDGILQIKNGDLDYLDKPPLLFWAAAISIKLFGVSSFSYKLVPLLGLLLSIYSIYRFCRLSHGIETSLAAATILAGSQVYFLMVNDVRAENLLIGFSSFAIWNIASYIKEKRAVNLYLGFAGVGIAMVAKGPIGLVFTAFTVGSMLLAGRNYRAINWRWLMALPIISIILLPMCIGLYKQFGTEGLKFYFWTQSFGRITGQSEWENNAGPLFFVHSFLWIFLPFSIVFLPALFTSIRDLFSRGKKMELAETGSLGGFVFTMAALSLSNYKLPHYIYPVTTLAAVLSAVFLFEKIRGKSKGTLFIIQLIFLGLILILSVFIVRFFRESYPVYMFILLAAFLISAYLLLRYYERMRSLVLISVLVMAFINLELNTVFYPDLLKYQSPSEAIFYLNDRNIEPEQLVSYKCWHQSLSFYLDDIVPVYSVPEDLEKVSGGTYIFTTDEGLSDIISRNINIDVIKTFDDYPVTRLTSQFLNPATRDQVLSKRYLLKVKQTVPPPM